jgi:outer membrane protein TolC
MGRHHRHFAVSLLCAFVCLTACRSRPAAPTFAAPGPTESTSINRLPDVRAANSIDAQEPNISGDACFLSDEDLASEMLSPPRSIDELPGSARPLTLDEAVRMALQHSQVIRRLGARVTTIDPNLPTAFDPDITASDPLFGVDAALGEFDPRLASRFLYDKNDRVFNNVTLGGGAQELLQDFSSFDTELSKIGRTGTRMALRNVTQHDRNNRQNNLFGHVWESYWQAEFRQPLLQGAGREFNEIAGPRAQPGFRFSTGIRIAKLNAAISQTEFEQAVLQLISDVHDAYWQLVFAHRDLEARQIALDAAEHTWRSVRARGQQRLAGGEADREAQARAQYYQYQDLVLEARNGSDQVPGVYQSERQLRYLIGLAPDDSLPMKPADAPPVALVVYDWPYLVATARESRIELTQQELRVRQRELELTASKEFLYPRLDVLAQYRVRGFGDDLAGSGPRFESAYQDIGSMDHQEWGFGMELDVPLGYRVASSGVRQAQLLLARERAVKQELERLVTHQLAQATASARQTHASLQSARSRAEACEERVQATEAAYQADRVPLDLLLDAQQARYEAQRRLFQLETEYAVQLKDVQHAAGQLLEEWNVVVAE